MSITQPECVFVALGIQHAMRVRHIFKWWPDLVYKIFPHHLINGTIFEKKKGIENKMCISSFSTNFV
jgi:hypothetical protein